MIGEIGGGMEAEAAHWIRDNGNKKPGVGFIAKMKIMGECGIYVVSSPDIGKTMMEVMSK